MLARRRLVVQLGHCPMCYVLHRLADTLCRDFLHYWWTTTMGDLMLRLKRSIYPAKSMIDFNDSTRDKNWFGPAARLFEGVRFRKMYLCFNKNIKKCTLAALEMRIWETVPLVCISWGCCRPPMPRWWCLLGRNAAPAQTPAQRSRKTCTSPPCYTVPYF